MKEYNGVNILTFTPSEIGKLCKSIDGYAGIIYCYTNLINAQKVYQYDKQEKYMWNLKIEKVAALAVGCSSSNIYIGRCIKEPWRTAGGFYCRSFKTNKIDITEWDTKD